VGTHTIGLFGLGRFGRLVYEHLRPHGGLRVWTRDESKLSAIAEAAEFADAAQADILVLTVAISAMQETCARLAPLLRPGQLVVDTCSVKVRPVEMMRQALPEGVDVLATHPLFGPDSGRDGIRGLKIVLCPIRVAPETYQRVRRFLESLGLVLIEATPEEHDRQAARTQAIFHLLAQALGRLGWGGESMATPGPEAFFRQIRAVQQDTPQLFRDMQRLNPYSADYRRQFAAALAEIERELAGTEDPPRP
jgi:prephenate dehydrogenase